MRFTAFTTFSVFALTSLMLPTAALGQSAPPAPSAPVSGPTSTTATTSTVADPGAPVVATEPARSPDSVEAEPAQSRDEEKLRRAYLSISPFHLILPMAEVMAEFRVHPKIGVAAIGGAGKVTVRQVGLLGASQDYSVSVWEAGGQLVGYPVGNFDHGMQVGAEVLYVGASTSAQTGSVKVAATGAGLSTGGFIGYKLATRVGFSFNVQGGVGYLAVAASDSNGAKASDSRLYPIVNANIGWSL